MTSHEPVEFGSASLDRRFRPTYPARVLLCRVRVALLVAVATVSVVAPAEATSPIKVSERFSGAGPRERPNSLLLGPDVAVEAIAWPSWGASTVTGTGTFRSYGGPDEDDGAPATVTLSRPRRCGPYMLYTRAVVQLASSDSRSFRPSVGCRVEAVTSPQAPPEDWMLAERPESMGLGDPHAGYVTVRRWTRWSKPEATGVGAIGAARVSVRLSRIRFCPRHATMVYTRGRARLSNRDGVRRYRFTIPASGCRA